MSFVSAVALALGREGRGAAREPSMSQLLPALEKALAAYPSVSAAVKVIGYLDPSARSSDPRTLKLPAILAKSEGFALVARHVLSKVEDA
jgi:hypothetical protein